LSIEKYKGLLLCFMLPLQHRFFFVCEGAIPNLLQNTKEEFFNKTIKILRETADISWEKLKGISAVTCPSKPQGSMFLMVCE